MSSARQRLRGRVRRLRKARRSGAARGGDGRRKLGEEIVVLDMRELVSYTDSGAGDRCGMSASAKAIADDVHLQLKGEGLLPSRMEGFQEARWVLLDYLDCVLHVFVPEAREHYRLEQLWGEAPHLEFRPRVIAELRRIGVASVRSDP